MLGLFRTSIGGATVAGLVGAAAVENIFFAAVATCLYLWLFLGAAGSLDITFDRVGDHGAAWILIVAAGVVLVALVIRILWRRAKETWENAKEGAAILSTPVRYLRQVVAVEAASYVMRLGVNATFMYAFDIPVSLENVLLIVASSSISSAVAIAPGAVGAQTALARVVLAPVAGPRAIEAYAVGQAIITTAWNVGVGLTLLARRIGWQQTRTLVHTRGHAVSDEGTNPDEAPVAAATPRRRGWR
jgi:glycosyltransferase 2 family protein